MRICTRNSHTDVTRYTKHLVSPFLTNRRCFALPRTVTIDDIVVKRCTQRHTTMHDYTAEQQCNSPHGWNGPVVGGRPTEQTARAISCTCIGECTRLLSPVKSRAVATSNQIAPMRTSMSTVGMRNMYFIYERESTDVRRTTVYVLCVWDDRIEWRNWISH